MAGVVQTLWRHPIKSHGREELDRVTLTEGKTMPWDRRWAVAHEGARTDGASWASCANFSRGSKAAELMAIHAQTDVDSGLVTLSHPKRPDLAFDPDQSADDFLQWVRPLMPSNRAQSTRLVRVPDRGMTDTDYPSISLLNVSSLRALSQKAGAPLQATRFRTNIVMEGLGPWEEFEWIGKRLAIGSAEVEVTERIERCMATTANPATGARDVDTLGALEDGWGHRDFGVYAIVTKTGQIACGDKIKVL
ncbi:MOSC domain-containing protein [Nereida sp. MMG025]|uniref:MOSC domain-containing protein n=1 Tax=Nereida sp. MMG025 TaxID=2909981 RepID=UPI001F02592E|nr:MOSC domain-containing protein [Nereida sp. MMG025]MCF6444255.1 MOSC domain-containing protein [Nereida sp. MMG025]